MRLQTKGFVMKTTSVIILLAISFSAFMFSGCANNSYNEVIYNSADFNDVISKLPLPDSNECRIVLYRSHLVSKNSRQSNTPSIHPLSPQAAQIYGASLGNPASVAIVYFWPMQPYIRLHDSNEQHSLFFPMNTQDIECLYLPAPCISYDLHAITEWAWQSEPEAFRLKIEPSKTYYVRLEGSYSAGDAQSLPMEMNEPQALADIRVSGISGNLNAPPITVVPNNSCSLVPADQKMLSADPNTIAKVYLIRKTGLTGAGNPIFMGFDSATGYKLHNDRYCCILASPGKHALTHSVQPTIFGGPDFIRKGNMLDLKAGCEYYFFFTYHNYSLFDIHQIDAEKGKSMLGKTKLDKDGILMQKL